MPRRLLQRSIGIAVAIALALTAFPDGFAGDTAPLPSWDAVKDHLVGGARLGGVASRTGSLGPIDSSSSFGSRPLQWSRNVNVFPNAFEQDEPSIAVNPTDPMNIVVGNHERQGPGPPSILLCAFEASFDGGRTWERFGFTRIQGPPFEFGPEGSHSCSDPVVAAAHTGDFYYAYLDLFRAPEVGVWRVDLLVAKSTDGGRSFPTFTTVSNGTTEDPDKEWLEVDRNPGSPFRGNVYVTYTDFSEVFRPGVGSVIRFRRSMDGGVGFEPSPAHPGTRVSDFGDYRETPRPDLCDRCVAFIVRYMQGSYLAVGPRGDLYVFYGDFTEVETHDLSQPFPASFRDARMLSAKIMVARSSDAGSTWNRSVVDDLCDPKPCRSAGINAHVETDPRFRTGTIPFGGVSPDGESVYAVWAEFASVTFSFDPFTSRDFGVSDGEIMFARSPDRGVTWGEAQRVNDDKTANDQFQPAMVVQPDTGAIHVVWMDRRLDPSNVKYHIFSATSADGGASFGRNVRVSSASSDPRPVGFIGDYIDIDGASGTSTVHAVWTDRRHPEDRNDVFAAFLAGPRV